MTKKAISLCVLAVAAAYLPAQDAQAPERASATGTFECGKMAVEYGVPTWNDGFSAEIKDGAVWRLGNNLPTTCNLDCGLMSANGPVTPGAYKLALKYVKEGTAHLLVYQGATFYNEKLPTWEIPSASLTKDDAAKQSKLAIAFQGSTMTVGFGPYAASFALKPVKTHPPVTTSFATTTATITTLALPVGDGPVNNLRVGVADIEQNGMKTSWGMYLTMEGEKASLAFRNSDPATVSKDKETLGGIVTRIKAMVEEHPERKEQAGTFISMFEKQIGDLDMKEKALGRLEAEKAFETTITKRETPASTLAFTHDRPTGMIVFTFGARDSDAKFEISPRGFQVRRR